MDYQTKETALIAASWIDIPENFTGVVWLYENYYWYINGLYHREDGPAVELANGDNFWFLNDKQYSQEEWFELLTPEQQIKFLWNLND